jgi:hypothetical protein
MIFEKSSLTARHGPDTLRLLVYLDSTSTPLKGSVAGN